MVLALIGVAGMTGCGSKTETVGLTELEQTLGTTLPGDAELVAGEKLGESSCWLIRTTAPLSLAPHTKWDDKQAIPAGVLPGLLAPFQVPPPDAPSSSPGELLEFRQGTCRVRIRSFETPDGWYVLVERFEEPPRQ
jgi:hypothetical protein